MSDVEISQKQQIVVMIRNRMAKVSRNLLPGF